VWLKLYLTTSRLAELLSGIFPPFRLALRFPPEAEEAFQQEHSQERIDHFRFSILYSIPLYDAFLLLDYLCLRQSFGLCLLVRLGIVTPLALVSLAVIPRVGRRFREVLFAVTPLPSIASILVLYNARLDLIDLGQIALILIMLYSIYAMWPDFRYACCVLLIAALGDSLFLLNIRTLDFAHSAPFIGLLWTAAFLSLQASYSMERQIRISYQLRTQLRTQNTELSRISTTDSLTGISNRRRLDSELRAQWKKCLHDGQPISALMIDLDHFKHFNDQHGHAYGDEVLIMVAKTLRRALRDKQDMVARYGGEEFAVILPNRPLASAVAIAQRLCDAVRAAELTLGGGVCVTISIGVASAYPSSGSGSTSLLRAADAALYEAKTHGRDRVWSAAEDRDQGTENREQRTGNRDQKIAPEAAAVPRR
jgi:diguanylate cyclase (GGDEF)-like protein